SMLLLTTSATTEIDTLSLHDALPIYTTNRSVLDRELARTKRTIDHDDAILIAHFTSIFLRKTSQHFLEVYDRTTAPARQLRQGLHADFGLFVEKPPYQRFGRQLGIKQLVVPHRVGENRDVLPFRMIGPRVNAVAVLFGVGQVLDEQSARNTGLGPDANGGPDQRRNLLALREISFDRLGERFAFERHDALIALVGDLESDREMALAEKRRKRGVGAHRGKPLGIVLDVSAKLTVAIVADEQLDHSALGLRLQGELAADALEQPAQQRGNHQRFGQEMLDRRCIGMGGQ